MLIIGECDGVSDGSDEVRVMMMQYAAGTQYEVLATREARRMNEMHPRQLERGDGALGWRGAALVAQPLAVQWLSRIMRKVARPGAACESMRRRRWRRGRERDAVGVWARG